MARDDICRSEGSLMDPERLGHPCGKTQFEHAIASSCQLIGRDDTSHANQQVGRDTARHAASKHQVFGRFTGRITLDDGTVLPVRDFFGFAEKVENKW